MTSSSTTTSPVTEQPTIIGELRRVVDMIDDGIAELLMERRTLSILIGKHKEAEGQPRIDLAREREVMKTYETWLGVTKGRKIAHYVLDYCKGK